jgi:hypothetical protein
LKNAVAYYNAGVVVVNYKVIGLDPGQLLGDTRESPRCPGDKVEECS